MDKAELLGLPLAAVEDFMVEIGEARFRARQVYHWIYRRNVGSFYEMTDLPKELREKLDQKARVSIPKLVKARISKDGTRKFLLELSDKKRIETVAIPQKWQNGKRYTLCVSTQVGCPLNCSFCATGQAGFERDMTAGEIVGQVLLAEREISRREKHKEEERIVSNLVFMGMGEPLLNLNAVLEAIKLINDPKGINIGQRHITVSTAGFVPGIERLAQEDLQITLAISLHATTDEVRNQLVPLNRKYPIQVLMSAARDYFEKTGRRITLEYILLADVNDTRQDAARLAQLAQSVHANINLIPYNQVDDSPYASPLQEDVAAFAALLEGSGATATIRVEMGADIEAACGQLRNRRDTRKRVTSHKL